MKRWDNSALAIREKLRPFLQAIKDPDTNNDSGGGDGFADIYVTVNGVEFNIAIKRMIAEKAERHLQLVK